MKGRKLGWLQRSRVLQPTTLITARMFRKLHRAAVSVLILVTLFTFLCSDAKYCLTELWFLPVKECQFLPEKQSEVIWCQRLLILSWSWTTGPKVLHIPASLHWLSTDWQSELQMENSVRCFFHFTDPTWWLTPQFWTSWWINRIYKSLIFKFVLPCNVEWTQKSNADLRGYFWGPVCNLHPCVVFSSRALQYDTVHSFSAWTSICLKCLWAGCWKGLPLTDKDETCDIQTVALMKPAITLNKAGLSCAPHRQYAVSQILESINLH